MHQVDARRTDGPTVHGCDHGNACGFCRAEVERLTRDVEREATHGATLETEVERLTRALNAMEIDAGDAAQVRDVYATALQQIATMEFSGYPAVCASRYGRALSIAREALRRV